jgi:hypothetical protein
MINDRHENQKNFYSKLVSFTALKQFRKAIIPITMMKDGSTHTKTFFFLYEDIPECASRDGDDRLWLWTRVCSGRVRQITYAMTAAVIAYAVRRCVQTFIPLCASRLGFQMCCRCWYYDDYRNHGQDMVPELVQGSEPGADLSHANSSKPKLCRKGSGRCGAKPTGNRVSSRTRHIVVGTSRHAKACDSLIIRCKSANTECA